MQVADEIDAFEFDQSVVCCHGSVDSGRSAKIPNPKHQAPEKSQTSNSKTCRRLAALELGSWSFSGVWSLVFGVFIRISALPSDLLVSPFARAASRQPGPLPQATTRQQ